MANDQLTSALLEFVVAYEEFNSVWRTRSGLSANEGIVLMLVEHDDGIGPVELARKTGLTSAGITTLLDRMENSRLLERTPDPADRRRVRVVITPEGRSAHKVLTDSLDTIADKTTALRGAHDECALDIARIGRSVFDASRAALLRSTGHPTPVGE
jgi:DNA-binding MarR family transcriptional regulator